MIPASLLSFVQQKTFRREATVERGTSAENMYFRSVVKGIISTIQRLPGNNMCCDCGAAGTYREV